MKSLALVTGASGFIGHRLCRDILERGGLVRALVRERSPGLKHTDQAVARDLTDREALRVAVGGVDTVFHLAARVHQLRDTAPDPLSAYRRANVEGTRTLLEESIRAGVTRFVFASSVKAVTGGGTTRPLTEEEPANPSDPYGISKCEAEQVVRDFSAQIGTYILRLPLVYGPGVKANMLALFRAVDRGLPLPFGALENRRSFVFSGNVTAAALDVVHTPAARGETFFVSDGSPVSTAQLIRAIAAALGRKARLVPVPRTLFRAMGAMGDLASHVVDLPLNSAAIERLIGSLVVDSSKLEKTIGRRPPFTMEQGLSQTARWYRGEAPAAA
jgi:nucleoside-diphosphate-sugar epimerase